MGKNSLKGKIGHVKKAGLLKAPLFLTEIEITEGEYKPGDKILDVGAGSGWTAAILAEIAGPKGKGVAMEIIPELVEFGEKNVAKYGFIDKQIVEFVLGDGSLGFKKEAPYDKILVSASGKKEPEALKKQLKINGRLVCCIENSIWLFIKKNKNEFDKKEYPGFVFVPLVQPVK